MRRRALSFALLALLTVGVVAAVLPSEPGRLSIRDAHAQASPPIEVRVAAQRLESGHTEFALQVVERATGLAGPRLLPSPRFLPPTTEPGRWRSSGPLELPGGFILRVSARLLEDGRIEFSMQQRTSDNVWSDRILPHQRMFVAYPPVRRWLVSNYVSLPQATYAPVINAQGKFAYTGYYFTTVYRGVIATGLRNYSRTWEAQFSVLCQYGFNLSLLSLPKSDVNPVDVTFVFSNGVTTTSAWRRYDTTILQSPDPWGDFNRMQQAESVTVEIPELYSVAQQFDLTDMFTTPIQGNLEHCGNYAPGKIRELPPIVDSYDTGSVTTFNGAYSEADWSWWREPGRLSWVTLEEKLLPLPGDDEAGNRHRLALDMSCDRRGVTVLIHGSVLDEGVERAQGGAPSVFWSLDGEPLRDFPWQLIRSAMHPQDARHFLKAVRQGTRLQVKFDSDQKELLAFDLSALFSSPAQSAFDECVTYPVRTKPLPYTGLDQWLRSSTPGVSYSIGTSRVEGLSWWTELALDEQSARLGEPYGHQQMRITCGLDGMAVDLNNVGAGQPVFIRGWPYDIEVSWRTETDSDTELWEVWDIEYYKGDYLLSPADDRDFYERIRGAETLTVSVPTEPRPVTLSFAFGETGVWDTPAAANLDACD